MCQSCNSGDPRDDVSDAARALRGLYLLLSDRSGDASAVSDLPTLVGLIDDKLFPASEALQNYVPRPGMPLR